MHFNKDSSRSSFCVSRLASLITRDPQQVIKLAKNVWYYLANTIDHGLQFENDPEEKQLNIYTDVSFGEICTGCHLIICFFGKVESKLW